MAKPKKRDEAAIIKDLTLALVEHARIYDGVLTPEVDALAKELRGEPAEAIADPAEPEPGDPS